MSRAEDPSLRLPPEDPARLRGFPTTHLSHGTDLFRVTRAGRGPWWFESSGHGRFDLPAPDGTCYLAPDPLGALLEVIGPELRGGCVSAAFLKARRLRTLRAPRPFELADATSRKAFGLGVTSELGVVVPYDLPQSWARKLHEIGMKGLLYRLRHDPGGQKGVALFGRKGERRGWRRGRATPIGDELTRRLSDQCGVRVLPVPRARHLTVLDDEA